MIPRVGKQGRSFKGAARYYLFDKRAETSERVAHVETRNLPTQDPDLGWQVMAATAMDADRLKREAGVDRRGRKLTKPVFHMSLSWEPGERPSHAHMVETMDSALAALGLEEHQAIYAIHEDQQHPHIHVFLNIVDPETGRSNSVRYSKERLSRWAQAYEQEHGIHCEQRIANNAKRADATNKGARKQHLYKEKQLDLKAEIAQRYKEAADGHAFKASMEELGFTLAAGKRIVLIGPDGKTHSLSRQLEGVKAAAVRKKLKGLMLPTIDEARQKAAAAPLKDKNKETSESDHREAAKKTEDPTPSAPRYESSDYFDRDQQQRDFDERIIDAGILNGRAEARRERRGQRRSDLLRLLQDRHIEERGQLSDRHNQARLALEVRLDAQYGTNARVLEKEIGGLERALRGRFVALRASKTHALEQARKSAATITQRREEAMSALSLQIAREREAFEERAEYERLVVESRFAPKPAASSQEPPAPTTASQPQEHSLSATFSDAAQAREARRAAFAERAAPRPSGDTPRSGGPTQA
jgi:hypothetical protein